MSMDYIRRTYGVPAKRGGRVEYWGGDFPHLGTITGSYNSGHIRVRLDGLRRGCKFHPTWSMKYLDAATPASSTPGREKT